jgi:hypothetical protein
VKTRLAELDKSHDTYEVGKTKNGNYIITITSGTYMKDNSIGQIQMEYDSGGKLKSHTQKYNNGKIVEITYNGGRKVVEKAKAAPKEYQDLANQLQKQSGGNVRIEYNSQIKKYILIQTNTADKNVKERRIVVDAKSWQEKTSKGDFLLKSTKDVWNGVTSLNLTKGINNAKRNLNSSSKLSDHFESETTTYANGKVTRTVYENGKSKTQRTLNEGKTKQEVPRNPVVATNSAVTVNNRKTLHTATEIHFDMPANASQNAKTFANSLIRNKEKLMKELGIDSDTYNMLAQTAMGIAKQETNFGEKTKRQQVKDSLRFVSDKVAEYQQEHGEENKSYMKDWSHGVTQLKYTLHSKDPWVKEKLTSLGITNEMQLEDVSTSAIATIVVLAKLNKEIDSPSYQRGIKTAQDTTVEYSGWEIGKDGIAHKTGNTKSWKNEITRQDVLCAFWNGSERASVKNGTFKPQGVTYTRNIRKYTQEYKLNEVQASRAKAIEKEEGTRTFKNMTNNGEMGGIVFLPAMYNDKAKHMNTPNEINHLREVLSKKSIDPNLSSQLISALQNGELGFDFGMRENEINTLTNADIKLLLKHINKLKSQVNSDGAINTSDGINSQEASKLRSNYSSVVGKAENDFRKEYLDNHSKTFKISSSNTKVLSAKSTTQENSNYVGINGQRRGFKHETTKGVNVNTTKGHISKQDELLANSAHNVVAQNPTNTNTGQCLTGVKKAMSDAGIDVSEMVKYGSVPKYIKNWFIAHPEMFTQVEYVATGANSARAINASDINSLPAGYFVIWEPENNNNYGNQDGHIAITNGNGQGYSDSTDNLAWGIYSNNKAESGKGEHGKVYVFKLSDNWEIGTDGKLKLKQQS